MRMFPYEKLSRLARDAGIDVVLAHTKPNVEYFTDFEWAPGYDKDNFVTEDGKSYAVSFVCLPQDEAKGPAFVAPTCQMGYPENNDCWITDVRYWGPSFHVQGGGHEEHPSDDPIAVLADVLREKGLETAAIGVEYGRLEMVYAERLRELLPGARLVDAEPVIWELRMFKSPEEVARMRRAADITSEVMSLAYTTSYEGMTEWDMEEWLNVAFAERGSRHIWTDVGFGPKGALFAGPTDAPLRRGEILRLDIGGFYKGYVADMSRSLAWTRGGPVGDAAKRAHAAIYGMNKALREAVRPGAVPSDLYRMTMRMFEESGYESLTPQAGHSLGRMGHEPPFLVPGNDRPLEPGMIVVVEPTMRVHGQGSFNIEDTTLVTEDGCEVLTSTPRELDAFL